MRRKERGGREEEGKETREEKREERGREGVCSCVCNLTSTCAGV